MFIAFSLHSSSQPSSIVAAADQTGESAAMMVWVSTQRHTLCRPRHPPLLRLLSMRRAQRPSLSSSTLRSAELIYVAALPRYAH